MKVAVEDSRRKRLAVRAFRHELLELAGHLALDAALHGAVGLPEGSKRRGRTGWEANLRLLEQLGHLDRRRGLFEVGERELARRLERVQVDDARG